MYPRYDFPQPVENQILCIVSQTMTDGGSEEIVGVETSLPFLDGSRKWLPQFHLGLLPFFGGQELHQKVFRNVCAMS